MNTQELSASDNVVRYVSLTHLKGGKASGSAFRPKETGEGLSVNWLEYFRNQEKSEQLNKIRELIRLRRGAQAKLAELNVGKTIEYFTHEVARLNAKHPSGKSINCDLQFVRTPLCKFGIYSADPSHCDIMTLPPPDSSYFDVIGDLIAKNVIGLYPAKLEKNPDPIALT